MDYAEYNEFFQKVKILLTKMQPGTYFDAKDRIGEEKLADFRAIVTLLFSIGFVEHWRYGVNNDYTIITRNDSLLRETFDEWIGENSLKNS